MHEQSKRVLHILLAVGFARREVRVHGPVHMVLHGRRILGDPIIEWRCSLVRQLALAEKLATRLRVVVWPV